MMVMEWSSPSRTREDVEISSLDNHGRVVLHMNAGTGIVSLADQTSPGQVTWDWYWCSALSSLAAARLQISQKVPVTVPVPACVPQLCSPCSWSTVAPQAAGRRCGNEIPLPPASASLQAEAAAGAVRTQSRRCDWSGCLPSACC